MNKTDEIVFKIVELIKNSSNICVLTGAGISTESGIPDFRTPNTGLWCKYKPEELLSINTLYKNPKLFYDEGLKLLLMLKDAKPNLAHYALSLLEEKKIIKCIITQNIDGLHVKANSKKVYEIHGHLRTGSCIQCNFQVPLEYLINKVNALEIPPLCEKCNGYLRPDVILFGDKLPICFDDAYYEALNCDLMIVIGSSLVVAPANMLPMLAKKLIIINLGETPLDYKANVIYRERATVALSNIVNALNLTLKL